MLRLSLMILGTLGLVNAASAQTMGYGVTPTEPAVMKCDLSKEIAPSASMVKVTGGAKTYGCAYQRKFHEIAFVGADFQLAQSKALGSKLILSVQCTTPDSPAGIYVYGGIPVGFQTSATKLTPWFYNPNKKLPGGRCFIMGDEVLTHQLKAVTNKSAMVILPRSIIEQD